MGLMLEPRDEAALAERFGTFIFRLRESKGISAREAAKQIGLSHGRLLNFEHGKDPHTGKPTLPSTELVGKMAGAYGYPKEQLLMLAGYMPWMVNEGEAVDIFGTVHPCVGDCKLPL
jgi:transcriptional regulator with XRE-family HTH domain